MSAIRIENLSHSYGKTQALAGVSLEVPSAQRYGLIGPNGGGKSTLMKILSTAMVPSAGKVEFLGKSLSENLMWIRSQIGVVFQTSTLDKKLTVVENLHLMARLQGLSADNGKRRSEDLVNRLELSKWKDARVDTLSGGTKRRAELALALLHSPKVLLLDEPTTGLDPLMRREFWNILGALEASEKTTTVVATHFLDEAEFCQRLALLHQGKVIAEGTPASLVAKFTEDVVTISAKDPSKLQEQLKQKFAVTTRIEDGELRFEKDRARELVPKLMEEYAGDILSVSVRRAGLESFFISRVEAT